MTTQSIRPSQFIITYGPGAIIEGKNGPRLIPAPNIGLFNGTTLVADDYEISDSRLSGKGGILDGARVFRLPSNAELDREESIPIYTTKIFPNWNLCIKSNRHDGVEQDSSYILYESSQKRCPICKEPSIKNQQAIRFIAACPEGHMDDVDWHLLIHNNKRQCTHQDWFIWIGGGSSLSHIFLTCPQCKSKSTSLEQAYRRPWPCHGRYLEKGKLGEPAEGKQCESGSKIIQRQASNLRVTDIVSLFTIPPRDTELHGMLDNRLLKSHVLTGKFSDKNDFEKMLKDLEEGGFIKLDTVNSILECSWDEITQAIADLEKHSPSNYGELINEELEELLRASRYDVSSKSRPRPSTNTLFEVDIKKVRNFTDANGRTLTATPINKLSEIAVQLSYRREIRRGNSDTRPAKPVDVSFTDRNGEKWYPGIKLHGEGIFVSTADGLFPEMNGDRAKEWHKAYSSEADYDSTLFRDEHCKVELHPLFIYLHTLSHSIIRSLSVNSGYSSSALRERIYLNLDGNTPRGGFLIYATQPGSDGTSGGLISLVDLFQSIFDSAIDSLISCSNDPLCIEDKFSANGKRNNGSSCYGCTLISETSCEQRNMWLDRGLVLENIHDMH